jgi:hypothetical protein
MLKKIDTTIWVSNLSTKTGEGTLAKYFLKYILLKYKNNIIKIKTFEKSFIYKNNNFLEKKIINKKNFFHKYFGPFYGIYYLWINRDKNIIYINYLPLWNFLIFLLLPKKTILGPITGGIYYDKVNNFDSFIRKYVFPIFFKISIFIIYKKFKRVIFSTDLLKYYITKSKYNSTLFNFVFSVFNLSFKKKLFKNKKKFDLIFYNRNHPTKTSLMRKNIINFLSKSYKICVVGDFYHNINVKNFGFVNKIKLYNLLKKSKAALTSEENFFSLFVIDAINCNLKIISFNKVFHNKHLRKYFFFLSKNQNIFIIKNKVKKILNLNSRYDNNFKKGIYIHQKKITNFIQNIE